MLGGHSERLQQTSNVPQISILRSTLRKIEKKETGEFEAKRSEKPRKLSEKTDQFLCLIRLRDRKKQSMN